MNQSLPVKDRSLLRRMLLFLSLGLFLLISLLFVLAPLYTHFSTDVLYMGTLLPDILDVLRSTVYVLVFGLFYGVLLYAFYRFPFKKAFLFVYIYVAAIFYKNIGILLITYLTDGVPLSGISWDLMMKGADTLLELLLTSAVVLISAIILHRAKKRESIRFEAAKQAKKTYVPSVEYLPFNRLLNFKNPLQKTAFWMAFVPMIVQVLQRAYYDISLTISKGFYGNPLIDVLWMLLYYTLDIVAYGVIVYFIEILIVSKLGEIDCHLQKDLSDGETNEIFGV